MKKGASKCHQIPTCQPGKEVRKEKKNWKGNLVADLKKKGRPIKVTKNLDITRISLQGKNRS